MPATLATGKRESFEPAAGELDLRAFPAPEPMVRALAAIDMLAPGATLVLWTPLLPLPLLHTLAARGLESAVEELADGSARVTVRHPCEEARRERR